MTEGARTIIGVLTSDIPLVIRLEKVAAHHHRVIHFTGVERFLSYMIDAKLDLLLIDQRTFNEKSTAIISRFRRDPFFVSLSVIAFFGDDFIDHDLMEWPEILVDDYLKESQLEDLLLPKAKICLSRMERIVEMNPLTHLPGNITINREIQRRLDTGDDFGFAYIDLDHFKPFNDKYGFSRGDDILRMLGRIILNSVRSVQSEGSFVGHVGGDDFVFITHRNLALAAAKQITEHFNSLVPSFYDPDDVKKKSIESVDRRGVKRTFPLLTVSIGVVYSGTQQFLHFEEMVQVAAEMKKFAKSQGGGVIKVDRRKRQSPPSSAQQDVDNGL